MSQEIADIKKSVASIAVKLENLTTAFNTREGVTLKFFQGIHELLNDLHELNEEGKIDIQSKKLERQNALEHYLTAVDAKAGTGRAGGNVARIAQSTPRTGRGAAKKRAARSKNRKA